MSAFDKKNIRYYQRFTVGNNTFEIEMIPGNNEILDEDAPRVEFPRRTFIWDELNIDGGYPDNEPIGIPDAIEMSFKIDLSEFKNGTFEFTFEEIDYEDYWSDVADIIVARGINVSESSSDYPYATFLNNRWMLFKIIDPDLVTEEKELIFNGFQLPGLDNTIIEGDRGELSNYIEYEIKILDDYRTVFGDGSWGDRPFLYDINNLSNYWTNMRKDADDPVGNYFTAVPALCSTSIKLNLISSGSYFETGYFRHSLVCDLKQDPDLDETEGGRAEYPITYFMYPLHKFIELDLKSYLASQLSLKYRIGYSEPDLLAVYSGNPLESWHFYKQERNPLALTETSRGDELLPSDINIVASVWDGKSRVMDPFEMEIDWQTGLNGWMAAQTVNEFLYKFCMQFAYKFEIDSRDPDNLYTPNFKFIPISARKNSDINILTTDDFLSKWKLVLERDNNGYIQYNFDSDDKIEVGNRILKKNSAIGHGPSLQWDAVCDNFMSTHMIDDDDDEDSSPNAKHLFCLLQDDEHPTLGKFYYKLKSRLNALFYLEEYAQEETDRPNLFLGLMPANAVQFENIKQGVEEEDKPAPYPDIDDGDKFVKIQTFHLEQQSNDAFSYVWTNAYNEIVGPDSRISTFEVQLSGDIFNPTMIGERVDFDFNEIINPSGSGNDINLYIPTYGIYTSIVDYNLLSNIYTINIAFISKPFTNGPL